MSTTACKRCNGTGFLPQFSHNQGGNCFACTRGRGTAGGAAIGWTRERVINHLHGLVNVARSHDADHRAWWLSEVCSADAAPSLPAMLAIADADVRARALAALERLFPAGMLVATLAGYRPAPRDAATAAFVAEMARRAAAAAPADPFAEFAA